MPNEVRTVVMRDVLTVMREDTNELRQWREAAQRRRGINPPIDAQNGERLTPEGHRQVTGRLMPVEVR